MKKQSCIICGKPLNNGIMIHGRGICQCCEKRLVYLESDTDFYTYYKKCLTKNVVQLIIRGEKSNCQNYRF